MKDILKLDAAGRPLKWIDYERAVYYFSRDKVLWNAGSMRFLRGGHNHAGVQSVLELPSIIAVKGKVLPGDGHVPYGRNELFRRDRCICGYCGLVFREADLTVEHIVPESRGGETSWTNTVAACKRCNTLKRNRTPEEAKMPLLYVPYEPNIYEGLILENRRCLVDQMAYLLAGVPKHSRLLM